MAYMAGARPRLVHVDAARQRTVPLALDLPSYLVKMVEHHGLYRWQLLYQPDVPPALRTELGETARGVRDALGEGDGHG